MTASEVGVANIIRVAIPTLLVSGTSGIAGLNSGGSGGGGMGWSWSRGITWFRCRRTGRTRSRGRCWGTTDLRRGGRSNPLFGIKSEFARGRRRGGRAGRR